MLYQSKLDYDMWHEAVYSATYILCSITPKQGQIKTPIEKWTKTKPNASNIKTFGTEVHAKQLTLSKKLDERNGKFIMVGYAPSGYRLNTRQETNNY